MITGDYRDRWRWWWWSARAEKARSDPPADGSVPQGSEFQKVLKRNFLHSRFTFSGCFSGEWLEELTPNLESPRLGPDCTHVCSLLLALNQITSPAGFPLNSRVLTKFRTKKYSQRVIRLPEGCWGLRVTHRAVEHGLVLLFIPVRTDVVILGAAVPPLGSSLLRAHTGPRAKLLLGSCRFIQPAAPPTPTTSLPPNWGGYPQLTFTSSASVEKITKVLVPNFNKWSTTTPSFTQVIE